MFEQLSCWGCLSAETLLLGLVFGAADDASAVVANWQTEGRCFPDVFLTTYPFPVFWVVTCYDSGPVFAQLS